MEKFFGLALFILGIVLIVKYKSIGRSILEQRKNLNKALPLYKEKLFNKEGIKESQILCLIIGIIIALLGISTVFG